MSHDPLPGSAATGTRLESRRGKCFGHSGTGNCARKPRWVTTQMFDTNPIWACGVHLSWLIRLRTAPLASITVTRLGEDQ